MAYYFTDKTQQSIIEYNNSTDQDLKDKLFREEIYPPFLKMSEILIHKYKFYYINSGNLQSTQMDVVCFLVEKLHKYSPEKGRAFSYFTIVARNWLILQNRKAYKKIQENHLLQDGHGSDEIDSDDNFILEDSQRFMRLFLQWMDEYSDKIYNVGNTREMWNEIRLKIDEVMNDRDTDFVKNLYYKDLVIKFDLPGPHLIYYVVTTMRKHYRFKKLIWEKRGYFDPKPPKSSYKAIEEWLKDL